MPLVRIDALAGRTPDQWSAIGDAVHRALVERIGIPAEDRFQGISGHASGSLAAASEPVVSNRGRIVQPPVPLMRGRGRFLRLAQVFFRYAWAAPATLIGLAVAGVACALGATARIANGVLEVAGGRMASLASPGASSRSFLAITFGHVVLGLSHDVLKEHRAHEHAHVRQYERWGVLFFPLYLGSSGAQLVRGRDPYGQNAFERQACASGSPEGT